MCRAALLLLLGSCTVLAVPVDPQHAAHCQATLASMSARPACTQKKNNIKNRVWGILSQVSCATACPFFAQSHAMLPCPCSRA